MKTFINYIRHKLARFIYPEIDKIIHSDWQKFARGFDNLIFKLIRGYPNQLPYF